MITSYGPTSDDDNSNDDSLPPGTAHVSKKKKPDNSKATKRCPKKSVAIGPQLPPGYVIPVEVQVEPKVSLVAPVKVHDEPEVPSVAQVNVQTQPKVSLAAPMEIQTQPNMPSVSEPKQLVGSSSESVPCNNTQNNKETISALQR